MSTRKTAPVRSAPRSHESFLAAETTYREAMALFIHKRDWARAREAFTAFLVQYGTERDVAEMADRARVHLRTCEEKLAPPPAAPRTAEEWMLQGVAMANTQQTDEALHAFDQARVLGATMEKVEYARAAVLSVAERYDEALEALRKAIEGNPDNRVFSLADPDFERLRETAGYVALVDPPTEFDERGGVADFGNDSPFADFGDEEDEDVDEEHEELGSEDEII